MPLNSLPPTITVAALDEKLDAARGQLAIDVGFWGGVVPGNDRELAALVKRGVLGFKCFLIDSGVPEFGWVQHKHLERALPILKDAHVPLLTHAELQGPCDDVAKDAARLDPRSYRSHVASRPKAAEDEAVRMMVALAKKTGAHVHIVHHSSSTSLQDIERAKADGLAFSAETCPHYLTFAAEDIEDGATHFKCTPPIRERANNEKLWDAVREGVLDFVVSDHSPCTAALKKLEIGDFSTAWGGIASLQVTLPAVWSGMKARGMKLTDVAERMSARPAAFAGLAHKGGIEKGKDADLVAFDPEARFTVHAGELSHKNAITPYEAREVFGVVRGTWLRGASVVWRGEPTTFRNGRTILGRA
jgi:allantoinase